MSNDVLYWSGGPAQDFESSQKLCESVSHGLVPVLWNRELNSVRYMLENEPEAEYWMDTKLKDGEWVWGEGSRIDSYMWDDDYKICSESPCKVTLHSKGYDVKLRIRNANEKHLNLCRLWTPNVSVMSRGADLWKHLDHDEKRKVTDKLTARMLSAALDRIQLLEEKLEDVLEKKPE